MSNQSNKVFFAFFIMLATTLNFSFFLGEMSNLSHHPIIELFIAIFINLIALTLKLGARTHLDSIQIGAGAVSCLLLLSASFLWFIGMQNNSIDILLPSIVGLSGGAFLANLFSIILLITDGILTKK
jgi:hypothetical protein